MLAKLLDIQFEHAALALVIGNLEKDVNLLVQLFHRFQGREGYLFQLPEPGRIRSVPEQDGVGGLSVPPGASGFLKIGLRAVGDIGMHHKADVGLVYPHAEGVGANHHPRAAFLPVFLPIGP